MEGADCIHTPQIATSLPDESLHREYALGLQVWSIPFRVIGSLPPTAHGIDALHTIKTGALHEHERPREDRKEGPF